MADTQNLKPSQKKEWFGNYVPKHTAKLIKESLENENSLLLPDANGNISSLPIINANTGWCLNAKDLIPAQLTREKNGYESDVVGTKLSLEKAKTAVKENEKGLYFNFKGQDGEYHYSSYFFPEQTTQPERLTEFAQKQSKNTEKVRQMLQDETLKVNSAEEYLGAYIASSKSGIKIEVSADVAKEFKKNMIAICDNELARSTAEKNPSIPKLSDVMFEADKKALDFIKSMKNEKTTNHKNKVFEKHQKIERD